MWAVAVVIKGTKLFYQIKLHILSCF
jgi:hypothetical protein